MILKTTVTYTRPHPPRLLIRRLVQKSFHTLTEANSISTTPYTSQAKPNATMAPMAPATKNGPVVIMGAAAA